MMLFRSRAMGTIAVLAGLTFGGLSGCSEGNNSTVMAPPPEAKIAPQPPVKEVVVPKGGAPSRSSAAHDSARGGTPPK